MPLSLGKLKLKFLGSAVIMSLLSPIILMTWLNCYKAFWWFYCLDTKQSICLISIFSLYELFPAIQPIIHHIQNNNSGTVYYIIHTLYYTFFSFSFFLVLLSFFLI